MHFNRSQFGPSYFRRSIHECEHQPTRIDPVLEARIAAYWRRETEHAIRMRIHQEKGRELMKWLSSIGLVCLAFAAAIYLLST